MSEDDDDDKYHAGNDDEAAATFSHCAPGLSRARNLIHFHICIDEYLSFDQCLRHNGIDIGNMLL